MVLNYYQDPGHGWIKVSRKQLFDLGIHKDISNCSYESHDGMNVFLEEDCDASLLIEALKARGIDYTLKSFHTDRQSKIRSYPDYQHYGG